MATGHGDEAAVAPEPAPEPVPVSVPLPAATTQRVQEDGHEEGAAASPAEQTASSQHQGNAQAADPPLPDEEAPPLPDEAPPDLEDDGWEPRWDNNANTWYFFNRRTGHSQWENPRVPEASANNPGPLDRFANYRQFVLSFLA